MIIEKFSQHVYVRMCVCVYLCVRERQREREGGGGEEERSREDVEEEGKKRRAPATELWDRTYQTDWCVDSSERSSQVSLQPSESAVRSPDKKSRDASTATSEGWCREGARPMS